MKAIQLILFFCLFVGAPTMSFAGQNDPDQPIRKSIPELKHQELPAANEANGKAARRYLYVKARLHVINLLGVSVSPCTIASLSQSEVFTSMDASVYFCPDDISRNLAFEPGDIIQASLTIAGVKIYSPIRTLTAADNGTTIDITFTL
ncbi:hypothetical protein SAMN05444266_106327 [Chitinophaga jiangningensis]|uniref:Uncharacterized protein n=1 Tax=Chitinophaga jiangningensis TaxID=1419482 RepID=A0A1M7FZF7_9BACT|nr:hypothetical protein [Chitinophaga jiangningensis]SHM09067.1 hypothetical protein SAMN05444266_106327 [Chitinophaga jiangningensis]